MMQVWLQNKKYVVDCTTTKMESLYACLKTPSKEGYEREFFWISGVLLVIVGFVGLIGNSLSLIILCAEKFRHKVFYNLLIILTSFDNLFIFTYGIKIGYQSMACRENYSYEVGHIAYPLLNVALSGSIYSTVAVSIERYLSVCYPHLKRPYRKTWIYFSIIGGITFLYNLPRFLERRFYISNGKLTSEIFPWAKSEVYKYRYHHWATLLIEDIIPIIVLIILNGFILKSICRGTNIVNHCKSRKKNSYALTAKILLVIVAIFMICHAPSVAYKILWYFGCMECTDMEKSNFRGKWFFITPIKKLFLIINSSVNFIVYCIMGEKFRNELSNFIKI